MGQDDLTVRIARLTQRILEQGNDIQREIRDLSLQAAREGKLDPTHLTALVNAVTQGVHAAKAHGAPPPPSSPLAQALSGLEDALSASAETLKLALQEAVQRTRQVGSEEIQRGKEELTALQNLFAEVVKGLTQGTKQSAHQTWDDFAAHMTDSSARLGTQLNEVVAELQRYLDHQAKNTAKAASDSAAYAVEGLAKGAAQALDQLAEALRRGVHKK